MHTFVAQIPRALGALCQWTPTLLFSHSIKSDSLQPHGLQYIRLPCPSPTPEACPNSCPLSQWCHQTIFSSAIPSSPCPQSSPTSGSFLMSQLFASGDQSMDPSIHTKYIPLVVNCDITVSLVKDFELGWEGSPPRAPPEPDWKWGNMGTRKYSPRVT